jgi:CRAL/TRIO domain
MSTSAAEASSSSTWPWLEGRGLTIAEAIPPVTALDQRRAVIDLITQHRTRIDQVRTELESDPLYNPNKHDDLWILRFLLSHKLRVKQAVKTAKFTLAFRAQHDLDRHDIRYNESYDGFAGESCARYMKYCTEDAVSFLLPDGKRGVVGIICLAGFDQHGLVKNVDESDWLPIFMFSSEWTHQWLDYITRTTGRLTKSIRIVDMAGVTLLGLNSENSRREGNAMGVMEDCYPQMLQSLVVCHAPPWIQVPWRFVRPIMPKRVVSKIDFIDPEKRESDRKRLLQYIALDHLPVRYGGTNKTWPVKFTLPPKNP